MTLELPKKIIKAEVKSPKLLLMYSPPKLGKTTLLAGLPDSLLVDLEDGSDYVDAVKYKVNNLKEFNDLCVAIEEQGRPYKRISIDTVTKLEEWCEELAKKLYQKTPMGARFDGDSVLTLPNGAGYLYLRMAVEKWLDRICGLADQIILCGHLRDSMLEKKGKEVSSKDLDLTGKIKRIVCQKADAIAYLYRDGDNVMASFKSSEEITCGARCEHLKGQEIILSEKRGDEIVTNWDKIYID